ncbi:MAG: glycoside hydrolase family 16 protein [Kiritimatiellia bacterium]
MKTFLIVPVVLFALTLSAKEQCVWRDEFNGTSLNSHFWTAETNFIRNIDAVQIYTDRIENLHLSEGALQLTSRHETFESTNCKPESPRWWESRKTAHYTSGSVNSKGKVEFCYGRLEFRARIEHGRGVWPALWLVGTRPGWPACGEIDVMEYVSQNPKTIHVTCHWTMDEIYNHPTAQRHCNTIDGQWHVYGLNWTPEKIEVTFDGKLIYILNLDDTKGLSGKSPFRDHTFYIILNQAVAGWSESPVAEDYPRTFAIDYVRLYQDPRMKQRILDVGKQQ